MRLPLLWRLRSFNWHLIRAGIRTFQRNLLIFYSNLPLVLMVRRGGLSIAVRILRDHLSSIIRFISAGRATGEHRFFSLLVVVKVFRILIFLEQIPDGRLGLVQRRDHIFSLGLVYCQSSWLLQRRIVILQQIFLIQRQLVVGRPLKQQLLVLLYEVLLRLRCRFLSFEELLPLLNDILSLFPYPLPSSNLVCFALLPPLLVFLGSLVLYLCHLIQR